MLEHAEDASADEEQLIHELHASCARLRPVLQRLASADTQNENLSNYSILHFIFYYTYITACLVFFKHLRRNPNKIYNDIYF